MTDREKAIVTAYTGVLMLDWSKFHEWVEFFMDQPVFSHEFASPAFLGSLKEKVKPEFLALCGPEEEGEWLDDGPDYKCSKCGTRFSDEITFIQWGYDLPKHCPECGIKMKTRQEDI